MALDSFLLALLEDPVDHGELLYVPSANVLYNPRKRVVYEVRDSIAVLLPDELVDRIRYVFVAPGETDPA